MTDGNKLTDNPLSLGEARLAAEMPYVDPYRAWIIRELADRCEKAEAELRRLAAIDSLPDLLTALKAVRDSLPGG